jgi:molybdenum cofactor biosynthesis enzyme
MFKSITTNTSVEIAINKVQHNKDVLLVAINTVKTLSKIIDEIDYDNLIRAIGAVDCAIVTYNISIDAVNLIKTNYDTTNVTAIVLSDLMTISVGYKTSWNMIDKFDKSKIPKKID